jgi:hypothetical protein
MGANKPIEDIESCRVQADGSVALRGIVVHSGIDEMRMIQRLSGQIFYIWPYKILVKTVS